MRRSRCCRTSRSSARSSSTTTRSSTCRTSLAPVVWWVVCTAAAWGCCCAPPASAAEVLADLRLPPRLDPVPRGRRRRDARRRRRRPAVDRLRQRVVREHDAGRGFVAVALVIFAAWHPFKVVAGAYLFGAALALSPALQARGYGINQFVLDALPYVVTLLVLVAPRPQAGRRRARRPDEGLRDSPAAELTPHRAPTIAVPSHTQPRRQDREQSDESRALLARRRRWRSSRAACGGDDGGTDGGDAAATARRRQRRRRGATARPARAPAARPSASSSSARRTTSATTRPPTRAARRSKAAYPDLEVLTAENVPEDDNATRVMEDMIDKGAKIIFATSYGHLDPALKVAADAPRRRRRPAGQLHRGHGAGQRRHLLRHRVRARVPRRHRRRQGDEDEQARLRLRLPDPADDRQHQRLRARRQVGQPRRRDATWSTRRTGATRPSRPRRRTACSPRAST